MTNEETMTNGFARIVLVQLNTDEQLNVREHEAIRVAIKSLEQQTCEDAVSRQAVLDGLASIAKAKAKSDAQKSLMGRVMFFTERLPSVNPQPKTGHWTKMVEVYDLQQNRMLVPYGYDDAKFGNTPVYVCDCGCESNKNSRFCPDCGCKMVEQQESEEQDADSN